MDELRMNNIGPEDDYTENGVPFQHGMDKESMMDGVTLDGDIAFTGFMRQPDVHSKLVTVPDFDEVAKMPGNISFTGLLDQGLTNSKAYTSWLDGVSPFEAKPSDIQEIANHISEEFSQAAPDVKMELFRGGFATIMQGNGTILYDAHDVIENDKMGFGAGNIVGSVAHEMGHNIVERVFADSGIALSRLQHEIGADFIEGAVLGMTDIDPSEKFEFLKAVNGDSPDYLSTEGRIEVIEKGIEWGDRLQFMGAHAPELMLDIGDNEVLRRQLMDVMDDYTDFG